MSSYLAGKMRVGFIKEIPSKGATTVSFVRCQARSVQYLAKCDTVFVIMIDFVIIASIN